MTMIMTVIQDIALVEQLGWFLLFFVHDWTFFWAVRQLRKGSDGVSRRRVARMLQCSCCYY